LKEPCRKAIADAKIDASKIDEVVLVGGSTRIPKVQQIAKDIFGKEPNRTVNPDEVVAIGAAIQGGVLAGDVKDVLLLDVTPLSAGCRDDGRRDDQAHRAEHDHPHHKTETFSTAADNQSSVRFTCFRASASSPRTTARWALHTGRHRAGAPRHAADRGRVQDRRQRHPERHRDGQGHE
jgi:molecular chaperone DnaK